GVQEYMLKATREAKQCRSWTANNVEFEDALKRFVEAVMQHEPFMTDVELFVNSIKDAGQVNSLAQTLMKHTAPGVPDLYQGGELCALSLVDPDNRSHKAQVPQLATLVEVDRKSTRPNSSHMV